MKQTTFWPSWGGPPRRPLRKADEPRKSYGHSFQQEEYTEKTQSWRLPDAEPYVFTSILLRMFLKPNVFLFVLNKSATPAAIHWTTARPNRARTASKTQGFGNMQLKMTVKTQGSTSEQCPDPMFSHAFMSQNYPGKSHGIFVS